MKGWGNKSYELLGIKLAQLEFHHLHYQAPGDSEGQGAWYVVVPVITNSRTRLSH